MRIDWKHTRILLRPGPTDMRKQIGSLSRLVEDLDQDPFAASLYLFCGRDRRRIKALYWDRNGFCLWTKRLERDSFPWPQTSEAVREITVRELSMLLSGIDFFRAHQRLQYRSVS